MDQLAKFIVDNEQEILERVISYAKERGYYECAPQDELVWRLGIQGLSNSLIGQCSTSSEIPELSPSEDYRSGVAGDFAILEARMHSKRGVTLPMFLSLMKYFRQSFNDVITDSDFAKEKRNYYHRYMDRFFDRVELGFISVWNASPDFTHEV